ncbi:MAG: response regulator transcription factor, partial [Polyangiales bacterium]
MSEAPSVLVVDDERDMCRLLEFNLRDAGFSPTTVHTAAAGLVSAARLRPAVIILDVMLPDMSGTEACRHLRADAELGDTGILMLTARGDEADRVAGLEAGADDYVVKPFSVRELTLRVHALVRRCGER